MDYEMIDYDQTFEYIDVTGINSLNDFQFYRRCWDPINGYSCGLIQDCFVNSLLPGINKIGLFDSYEVQLFIPFYVDGLCPSDFVINATLTLSCAQGTLAPTQDPTTAQPTSPTIGPTSYPSISPTDPTIAPTPSPTWSYQCDTNTYCFPLYIYPEFATDTTYTVPVQHIDTSFFGSPDTIFKIQYHVWGEAANDCVEPKLTIIYETIDYDQTYEYMDIIDMTNPDQPLLQRCGENYACGVFETCLSNYQIPGISKIERDTVYEIAISQSSSVDALCAGFSNPYVINATVTLKCESGTANPTPSPTKAPTSEPTTPTSDPTTAEPTRPTEQPTLSPTFTEIDCSDPFSIESRFCQYIDISPELDTMTSFSTRIKDVDQGFLPQIFDIFFTVDPQAENDCVDPKIMFNFEKIDTDSTFEYINVTNNNDELIAKCGAGAFANDCGDGQLVLINLHLVK